MFEKLNKKYSITGLGYSHKSFHENYFSLDLSNKAEVINFALNEPKCDVLIFLVGLAHEKGKGQEYKKFQRVNKKTLVTLLSVLGEQNKRPDKIIFASTISVYGEKINQNIYNENSAKESFSPYALTKLEAEEYLLNNYIKQSWILRLAPVYAPDFQLNINRRTKACGCYYKIGNGEKKLSLCILENISKTVEGILQDKVPTGTYNISDKESYTYNSLLKYVNAKWTLRFPIILVWGLYYFGKIINNNFLKENCVKLITDNIFSSEKIRKHVELTSSINQVISDD